MKILNTLLFFWMAVAAFGQIPYEVVKTLDDGAKELRQVKGFSCELIVKHADTNDTRDFQVWLETPKGRAAIEIKKNGTFRLPVVKADEQHNAQLIHSLEKGALILGTHFNCDYPSNGNTKSNLFEVCSDITAQMSKVEHVFTRLVEAAPKSENFPIVIVGVSLMRDVPRSGLALLKNGKKTVASVDLSQTGVVSWMFADYDPMTHRVEFVMKNGATAPSLYFEMRKDNQATRSKGAIVVRKPR